MLNNIGEPESTVNNLDGKILFSPVFINIARTSNKTDIKQEVDLFI